MAKWILIASLFALPAFAQDFDSPKDQEIAYYAGVTSGLLDLDIKDAGLSFSDSAYVYGVTIGARLGYGKVAIEGSRFETSSFSDTVLGVPTDLDVEGASIRVMGRFQLHPNHAFIAGAGSHRYKATASASASGFTISDSDRETDGSLFAGWEMDTSRLFIRALYESFDSEADLTGITASVAFKFGAR